MILCFIPQPNRGQREGAICTVGSEKPGIVRISSSKSGKNGKGGRERGRVHCSFHGIADNNIVNRSSHICQVQFTPIKSSLYVFVWNMVLRLREHLLAPGDFLAEQFIRSY